MNVLMLELVRMLDEANTRCEALRHDKEVLKCELLSWFDYLDEMRDQADLEYKRSLACIEANERLRSELDDVRAELAQTLERLRNANKELEKLRLSKEV